MKRCLALLWLPCAACAVALDVTDQVQVSCGDTKDCPEGFTCKSTIARCVANDASDNTAPAVLSSDITPTAASIGAVVVVTMNVDEELFVVPTVALAGADGPMFNLRERQPKDAGGETLVFAYDVLGTETEGDVEVVAHNLVDAFGNVNASAVLGSVTFDFTPPTNPSVTVAPAVKTGTAAITLNLAATDATDVFVSGDLVAAADVDTWRPMTTTLSVALVTGDGDKQISAQFRDAAGNTTAAITTQVELDTVAPAAIAEPLLTLAPKQSRLGNGSSFGIHAELGELGLVLEAAVLEQQLAPEATFMLVRDLGQEVVLDGTAVHEATAIAATGLTDGANVRVRLELSDGVNQATLTTNAVLADTTNPMIQSLALSSGGTLTGNRNVALTIVTSSAATEVRIGGDARAVDWTTFASPFAIELLGDDGTKNIQVAVRDETLQGDESSLDLVLNTTPPRVTVALTLADAAYGKTHLRNNDSGIIQIRGQATETGTTLSSVDLLGELGGAATTVLKSLTVPSDVDLNAATGALTGSFNLADVNALATYEGVVLRVVIADAVSNLSAPVFSNPIPVDVTPPTASLQLASSQPDPTNAATVALDLESTDGLLVCYFGADTTAGANGCNDPSDFAFMVSEAVGYVQLTGATQGSNTLSARVRDRAFNTVDVSTTVHFDSQAPSIVSSNWVTNATTSALVSGTMVAWSDARQAVFRVEPSELPVTLEFGGDLGALSAGCASVNGRRCNVTATQCPASLCAITMTLQGSDVTGLACDNPGHAPGDGLKRITVTAEDAASNIGTPTAREILLDRTCPDALVLSSTTTPPLINKSGTNYVAANAIELRLDSAPGSASVDEDFDGYEISTDGSHWSSNGASERFSFTLSEGTNTLRVRGHDVGGHTGPVTTLVVLSDTTPPSTPVIGPANLVFNGDTVQVVLTKRATDALGFPGAELSYDVLGGPYTEWTATGITATALEADVTWPFFEVAGVPRQQAGVLMVRAKDPAGNVSLPALLSYEEQSTTVLHRTSGVLYSSTGGAGSLGLWADHILWTEASGAGQTLYRRTLGGATKLVWSTTNTSLPPMEVLADHHRIAWVGINNAGQGYLWLADVGPDQIPSSGDETWAAAPSWPTASLSIPFCVGDTAIDLDPASQELVYLVATDVNCTGSELRIANLSAAVPATTLVCSNCTQSLGSLPQIAIHSGCISYPNAAGKVVLRCKGSNGIWGDGDDTTQTLSTSSGACSNPLFHERSKALEMDLFGSTRLVGWVDRTAAQGSELCVWDSASNTTSAFVTAAAGMTAVAITEPYLYSLIERSDGSGLREVHRRAWPSGIDETLPVPAGTLGRLRAFGDHAVVARSTDGDDQLEWVTSLDERQVSPGVTSLTPGTDDAVTPDIDGNLMVWTSYADHACGEIYLHDRAAGTTTRLTTTTCPASGARPFKMCPQLSGTRVIWWQDNADPGPPTKCGGELYGLDLSSGPPFDGSDIVWLSQAMTGHTGLYSARISGSRVLFGAYNASFFPHLYLFDWSTMVKPTLGTTLGTDYAGSADIDGDRVAYVYWGTPAYEIRVCSVTNNCATPVTVVPAFNAPCQATSNEDQCELKFHPRLRGNTLVWLDNRSRWDANATLENTVSYHLYWYDLPPVLVPAAGVRVSTTPWATGVTGALAASLVTAESSGAAFWDFAKPEIGNGFVGYTSIRDSIVTNGSMREVVIVPLSGSRALVEQSLTRASTWQMAPAIDATGQVVWQDKRDGTSFQLFVMTP